MKHLICLILLSALTLATVQCSDEPVEFQEFHGYGSRSIAPEDTSETNPTLLTDWENCKTVKLNEVSSNGENEEVSLPWREGVGTALDSKFCSDIKAADGWIMLFHTFCKSNTDVDLSYMCLYNKFTGYLKVFYYSKTRDLGSSTIWNLSSSVSNVPQPLFADLEYFSQPIEGDGTYSIWSATADNMITSGQTGLTSGWNGFEFRIGEYHPKIATEKLRIQAFNTAYMNIKIDGVTESITNGTITTNASSYSGGKKVDALVSVGGSTAKGLVDKFAKKHLDKSFLGINIKDIVANVAVGNYVSAFMSGLGCIFKGLFKQEPTVSEVKLQSNGTLTLQGKADVPLTSTAKPLTFDFDSIFSKSSDIKELGVWNLKKKPTIYYDRYTKFENEHKFTVKEIQLGLLDFTGSADYPETRIYIYNPHNEVVFNPAIKDFVKSYSVNVALIDVEGGNRVLNNIGKHIIAFNRDNEFKTDSIRNIRVYGVDSFKTGISGSIYDYPDGLFNEDTEFYVDWGENVGGNRAAVVTLTMNVDYNGKQMSFTESRVYDVIYEPYSPDWMVQTADNPPYAVVINKKGYNLMGLKLPTQYR